MRTRWLAFVALAGAAACASATAPDAVGAWGGTQASLMLTAAGGTVSYQCGSGQVDSTWTVSSTGSFLATGEHYFGGGPVPVGGPAPHPAVYRGDVDGDTFTFTVTLTDLSETLGPFRMVRGGPQVQEICL